MGMMKSSENKVQEPLMMLVVLDFYLLIFLFRNGSSRSWLNRRFSIGRWAF